MKRLVYTLVLVLLAGGVWRAAESFRIKHPVSGRDITVPGREGPNAMLVSGWKTTNSPKAERELCYRPRPARQAVKDSIEWLKARGLL